MKHRSNRVKRYVRSARTMHHGWLVKLFSNLTPLSMESARTLTAVHRTDYEDFHTLTQYGQGVEAFAKSLLENMKIAGYVEKAVLDTQTDPTSRKMLLNPPQAGAHAAPLPPLFTKADHEKRVASERLRIVLHGKLEGRLIMVDKRPKKENEQ